MDFIKVYDLSDLSFFDVYKDHFYIIIPLLMLIIVVIALFTNVEKSEKLSAEKIRVKTWQLDSKLVFGTLIVFIVFVSTNIMLLIDYVEFSNALKNNQCSFVEGEVFNYVPLIKDTKGDEEFQIDGVKFRYSNGDLNAGFHGTHSGGNVIRPGVYLKIWYVKTGFVTTSYKYPLMIKVLKKRK